MASPPDDPIPLVRQDLARGEFLLAFDRATTLLAERPTDIEAQFLAVLALARAGATERARARYEEWDLKRRARASGSSRLRTDVLALDARLQKDDALRAPGRERKPRLALAARSYERLFRSTADSFPGINAATLWLLAGEEARARAIARRVDRLCSAVEPQSDLDRYYRAATLAESALVRGRAEEAREHLAEIARLSAIDLGAVATTRRQLRLLCEETGRDASVLDALPAPGVIHYAGHRIGSRFPERAVEAVAARIRRLLAEHRVAFGFGSLASGADILFAEALLARRAELHVVLPFAVEEFRRVSVGEGSWGARFDRCLARANSVTFATQDRYLGDDELFTYASRIAMGLAVIRARFLETEPLQIAAWDGETRNPPSLTLVDVLAWARRGHRTLLVATDAHLVPSRMRFRRVASARRQPRRGRLERVTRAMLFGDFKGFSKLDDRQTQVFVAKVLGRAAAIVDRYGSAVRFKNTWGDGLYLVLDDIRAAAALAVDLQAAIGALDLEALGLPPNIALRLGGHAGPVFEAVDPVLDRVSYFGSHVSRSARIEPVTQPGAIYVSDVFAATLALEPNDGIELDYVGRIPSAKGYGVMGMYRLTGKGRGAAGGRVTGRRRSG